MLDAVSPGYLGAALVSAAPASTWWTAPGRQALGYLLQGRRDWAAQADLELRLNLCTSVARKTKRFVFAGSHCPAPAHPEGPEPAEHRDDSCSSQVQATTGTLVITGQ